MFLGSLREAEVERINDRMSQAIMETCLAMTIFREGFNIEFCAMFTVRQILSDCLQATLGPIAKHRSAVISLGNHVVDGWRPLVGGKCTG